MKALFLVTLKFLDYVFLKGRDGGLPRCSAGKEPACNTRDKGDADSILGSRRSSGGGNGNPLTTTA